MKYKFFNVDGKLLFTYEAENQKQALMMAISDNRCLKRLNLDNWDLSNMDLSRRNFNETSFQKANLQNCNLAYSVFWDANLSGADVSNANLTSADLYAACCENTNFRGSKFNDTNLRLSKCAKANFINTNIDKASLHGADFTNAKVNLKNVPKIKNLDALILDALTKGGKLKMDIWHSSVCKTTHCRAGWAIYLAGKKGHALEAKFGSEMAGSLIYLNSTGRIPDFYCSNAKALSDIRKHANLSEKVEIKS